MIWGGIKIYLKTQKYNRFVRYIDKHVRSRGWRVVERCVLRHFQLIFILELTPLVNRPLALPPEGFSPNRDNE